MEQITKMLNFQIGGHIPITKKAVSAKLKQVVGSPGADKLDEQQALQLYLKNVENDQSESATSSTTTTSSEAKASTTSTSGRYSILGLGPSLRNDRVSITRYTYFAIVSGHTYCH
jgi:hypothetical protein